MTTKRWVSLGVSGLILLAAAIVAWEYWPAALRYREAHAFSVVRSRIASYLAGKDSLTAAACQLAPELVRWQSLSMRLQSSEPAQRRRIVDPGPALVPPGTDPNDPKFVELMLNASRFAFSKDFPPELRRAVMEATDSTIRERRFRRVQCGAA